MPCVLVVKEGNRKYHLLDINNIYCVHQVSGTLYVICNLFFPSLEKSKPGPKVTNHTAENKCGIHTQVGLTQSQSSLPASRGSESPRLSFQEAVWAKGI